jgi:hypothetical protein
MQTEQQRDVEGQLAKQGKHPAQDSFENFRGWECLTEAKYPQRPKGHVLWSVLRQFLVVGFFVLCYAQTQAAVTLLTQNESLYGQGQIFDGPLLSLFFNDLLSDPRTPDIVAAPTWE